MVREEEWLDCAVRDEWGSIMDAREFCRIVHEVVQEESVDEVVTWLQDPGAFRVTADELALSKWFKELSEDDQHRVRQIVRKTAVSTTYSFLSLLDNILVDEDEQPPVLLDLYTREDEPVWLNNPDTGGILDFYWDFIHDPKHE